MAHVQYGKYIPGPVRSLTHPARLPRPLGPELGVMILIFCVFNS